MAGMAAGFVPRIVHISRKDSFYSNGRGAGCLWPFDPGVPFRENLHGSESQGGHTLWRQYKEAGMSSSSEKNCEAASCQGFLSCLYFLFPVALYWQQMDYSLIQSLDILSHMLLFFFFYLPHPPFSTFFPSNSPGFPFSSCAFCHLFFSVNPAHVANLWEEANNKTTGTTADPSVRGQLHFTVITRFIYFNACFSPWRSNPVFTTWFNYEEKLISLLLIQDNDARGLREVR